MTTREFLKKLTPSPVTALLIGLIAYLWFRPPAFVDDMARPAPDIPELAALKGKVVLVNFWATWCPYCRHEMPAMEAFYQAHRDKGFEIVAYSLDKSQAEVEAYMREEGYTFPTSLIYQAVSEAFGGVNRVPLSFVIDRNGVIRHRIAGQLHAGRLDSLITPLLATPSGSGSR
jgi:thiol-disulfide isomerase/thioredoxin